MKINGNKNADWRTPVPENGWHNVEITEGINRYSGITKDGRDYDIFTIPVRVTSGDAEGAMVSIIVDMLKPDKAEQRLSDVIVNAGIAAEFEKGFPDGTLVTDNRVLDLLKVKLPFRCLQVYTELNKAGKANVYQISAMDSNSVAEAQGGGGDDDIPF